MGVDLYLDLSFLIEVFSARPSVFAPGLPVMLQLLSDSLAFDLNLL